MGPIDTNIKIKRVQTETALHNKQIQTASSPSPTHTPSPQPLDTMTRIINQLHQHKEQLKQFCLTQYCKYTHGINRLL